MRRRNALTRTRFKPADNGVPATAQKFIDAFGEACANYGQARVYSKIIIKDFAALMLQIKR